MIRARPHASDGTVQERWQLITEATLVRREANYGFSSVMVEKSYPYTLAYALRVAYSGTGPILA